MWPVILRELRAGSRRWTTYWLRLLGASVIILAILYWFTEYNPSRRAGSDLFAVMHRIIFGAIWVLAPLLACDCLSQEKREGTLGLLFLTNLKARHIVAAKVFAHGLRSLTMWLAMLPIIAVPLLLGGLHWKELLLSIALMLSAVSLGTAAGIAASSASVNVSRAAGSALFLSALLFLGFGGLIVFGWGVLVSWLVPKASRTLPPLDNLIEGAGAVLFNVHGTWNAMFTSRFVSPKEQVAILVMAFVLALISFVGLLLILLLSASQIRRNWQDKPKTKRQTEVETFFCTPVFWTGTFRAWMRRSLERNPIGWLEKRSWTGRIVAWIWLAVMISFASALAYSAASRNDLEGYNALMWLLLGSIAYVAAGSFRRERETGALELILVTPLSERHVIFGRLRGLWSQFLPTFIVWIAVVIYLSSAIKDWQMATMFRFSLAYLIVPVVGLYFSLRTRFVLLSWLATLTACFALPQLFWWSIQFALQLLVLDEWARVLHSSDQAQFSFVLAVQLVLAASLLWRLHVNLVRRSFSLR